MTDQLCAMCGEPKSKHAESRPDGAPVPRNGCGSLLRHFRPKTPAPTVRWIKLKRGNDWGVDYFAIEPLSNGGASASRGIKLEEGEPVRVRLADGSERDGVIALRTEIHTVSDHGHSYPVTSKIPVVRFDLFGQTFGLPIDEVEVDEAWARSKGAQ